MSAVSFDKSCLLFFLRFHFDYSVHPMGFRLVRCQVNMSNLKLSVNLSCSCVVLTSQNGGKKSTLYHNFNVIVILLLRFLVIRPPPRPRPRPGPGPRPRPRPRPQPPIPGPTGKSKNLFLLSLELIVSLTFITQYHFYFSRVC